VLNCISSTSHSNEALQNLLVTISNISSVSDFAELVVSNRALEFLQPVVLHDDLLIALAACGGICTLAAEKKFFALVDRSEALPVVLDVLRTITPGSLYAMSQWSSTDLQSLATMMSADAHPAVQLCALHNIGKSFHMEANRTLFFHCEHREFVQNSRSIPGPVCVCCGCVSHAEDSHSCAQLPRHQGRRYSR
jgi:hypothetical protein